jgi:acyl carrier protein
VLALVAEKTGYPVDMLDLDLDLEADLGVDTVKQAEVFATIREAYNIPRDENRKLRDYPNLGACQSVSCMTSGRNWPARYRPRLRSLSKRRRPKRDPINIPARTALRIIPRQSRGSGFHGRRSQRSVQGSRSVKERFSLWCEKTGYPKDMLDLDLDLEADLGVDTVKQAEMFAAIRAAYNIPRDENRKLRDYPTLAHVIRFVYEKRPDLAGEAAPPSSQITSEPTVPNAPPNRRPNASTDDAIKEKVLEIVAEKSGYPKDMLDLDLDLEADLGIDTVKQAEMFAAVRAAYNIPRDENLKLRDFRPSPT